jgi:hypothetical protein
MNQEINITIDNASPAEAAQLILDLQAYLLSVEDVSSVITKENDDTQDFGATLVILLGSTSITALISGLSNWLVKKQERKLTIKSDGEIIGENLSSGDIERILESIK